MLYKSELNYLQSRQLFCQLVSYVADLLPIESFQKVLRGHSLPPQTI